MRIAFEPVREPLEGSASNLTFTTAGGTGDAVAQFVGDRAAAGWLSHEEGLRAVHPDGRAGDEGGGV